MEAYLDLQDISNYLHFLKEEERSKVTIEKYRRDIKLLYRFLDGHYNLTKEKMMAFKSCLSAGYKTGSVNSMLASINGFLTWKGIGHLRVKSLKTQKRLFRDQNQELGLTEYEHLIREAKKKRKYRLEMIIQTIGGTGIRISELSKVTVEAVTQGQAIVEGKGKHRVIFFSPRLRKYLLKYCKKCSIQTGPVFITRNGQAIDRSNVWREMKQLSREAGISEQKVYPHNLRHLFARICYQKKKDIVYLADLLGHSNIETTRIYTVSSGREHKQMLDSLGLIL